jgi:hypothetical protein
MMRELHARVLDAESGDQLGLGLENVERHAVLRGDAGDNEREETELAEHGIEDEPQTLLRRAMSDSRSEPAAAPARARP